MPSAYVAIGATEARSRQPSSISTGSRCEQLAVARGRLSRSSAGNGCSTNSTPSSISSGVSSRAVSRSQPSLPSMRSARAVSRAHRAQALEVAGAADLDLEHLVAACARRVLSAVPSTVSMPIVYEVGGVTPIGARAAARPAARRACRPSRGRAPSSAIFAPCGPSQAATRAQDRLAREQVVAEQRGAVGLERGDDPVGRLAPVVDRRALAARDDPVVLELGDDDGLLVRRPAGDLEGLAQGQARAWSRKAPCYSPASRVCSHLDVLREAP